MWWRVPITGSNGQFKLVPALNARQAQTTVNEMLNQAGYAHHADAAQVATETDKLRWLDDYQLAVDQGVVDEWDRTVYRALTTPNTDLATITPAPSHIPTRRAPVVDAGRATGQRLGRLLFLSAVGLLSMIAIPVVAFLWLAPPAEATAISLASILAGAVFLSEWLERTPHSHPLPTNTQRSLPKPARRRDWWDEAMRRRILKHHRRTRGNWCTGTQYCNPDGHPTDDLTVDHKNPQSLGGTLADGWRVICRQANSARGNRPLEVDA